jgi:hypothetical protein
MNTPRTCGVGSGGITNWQRYYYAHFSRQTAADQDERPAPEEEEEEKPPLKPQAPAAAGRSHSARGHDWRRRFESVKTQKSAALTDYLARREAHKRKVCEKDAGLHTRLGMSLRVAEDRAARSLASARAAPQPPPTSARSHQSLWTPACLEIAAEAASHVLAARFRRALDSYTDRQRYAPGGEAALLLAAVHARLDAVATLPDDAAVEDVVRATCRSGAPATPDGVKLVAFFVQLLRDVQSIV